MTIEQLQEENRHVDRHRGSNLDWLKRHETVCREAAALGAAGVRVVAVCLLHRAANMCNLSLAWEHVAERSGTTAGLDGIKSSELSESEQRQALRDMQTAIAKDEYLAGPTKRYRILKNDGGFRWIHIPDLFDRVVQRAIVQVAQPLLECLLDPHSFAYRTNRDRFGALARAEYLTTASDLSILLSEDLKAAFDHVPIERLLQVWQKYVPNPELTRLIRRAIDRRTSVGLLQGGPLSPLLLNVYCDHVLDRPWRSSMPAVPLLRYADDLLVPCTSVAQAQQARYHLVKLLRPAGFSLKSDATGKNSIHQLALGESVCWLGTDISLNNGELRFRIPERSWQKAFERLQRCDPTPADNSQNVVTEEEKIVTRWLRQMGPAYRDDRRDDVFKELFRLGRLAGIELEPFVDKFKAVWRKAFRHWDQTRKRAKLAVQEGTGKPRQRRILDH